MGSEIQVSGAQMQALHLLAVASGKVGFAICLTGWNGAGNLSRDCLSHGKSPSKPLDCFKAASFLSLCYRSITKRHRLIFFFHPKVESWTIIEIDEGRKKDNMP